MIYVVQTTSGVVKVGHTDDVDSTVADLQAIIGEPLTLLGAMAGGPVLERWLRRKLSPWRMSPNEVWGNKLHGGVCWYRPDVLDQPNIAAMLERCEPVQAHTCRCWAQLFALAARLQQDAQHVTSK